MSGIAQMFRHLRHEVAGSDREIAADGVNATLLSYLRKTGIKIFPQDASFIKDFRPDIVVYSSAIEKDNPDFKAAMNIKMIHRSEALRMLIENSPEMLSVAVTGTSGKTTVSAWIADTLDFLNYDPTALIGGKSAKFAKNAAPGNFRPGHGRFLIIEADESDKSILNYSPDYAVILNTGPDHYPVEEQNEVFAKFAKSAKKGVVCSEELLPMISKNTDMPIRYFGTRKNTKIKSADSVILLDYITAKKNKSRIAKAIVDANGVKLTVKLPLPGKHNALNACAVMATLSAIGINAEYKNAIESFSGIERRFNILGKTSAGAIVIDDYAHNPDKIKSSISTAKELSNGRLFFVFQPHGYGPLGFMQDKLGEAVKESLDKNDIFIFLPVFYAGGTSSFKPSSEEVVANFANSGIQNCEFRKSREELEELLKSAGDGDIIVVAGARDESLSLWAKKIRETI